VKEPREAEQRVRPRLWPLTRAFGVVGTTSMGGGRFAFFYHELARRRRWLNEEELLESLALSQLLPGPNIGNLSVLLGQRLRGRRGAALALLAMLLPGALLMLALSVLYFGHGTLPGLEPALRGVAAAAAGLALATALQVGWRSVRTLRGVLLAALSLVLIVGVKLPTLLLIVALGALGTLLFRPADE
jgi:chromate transporter